MKELLPRMQKAKTCFGLAPAGGCMVLHYPDTCVQDILAGHTSWCACSRRSDIRPASSAVSHISVKGVPWLYIDLPLATCKPASVLVLDCVWCSYSSTRVVSCDDDMQGVVCMARPTTGRYGVGCTTWHRVWYSYIVSLHNKVQLWTPNYIAKQL